jgi:DNA-binding MarR family transcriptional regulator
VAELSSPHIGQLLRDAFARFEDELIAGTPPFRGFELRPVHNHVLRHLDRDGTRASVIAERSGLTRQAITQIVDELEEVGVVTREPDPEDGRAKQIVYTPEAMKAFDEGRKLIADIERRWKREVGAESWTSLQAALGELTAPARRGR